VIIIIYHISCITSTSQYAKKVLADGEDPDNGDPKRGGGHCGKDTSTTFIVCRREQVDVTV
jgi:hypothetical protein